MKYLIDTHILLWFLDGNDKLPPHIRQIIVDEKSMIYVSVVSLWESAIKMNIGKLPFNGGFPHLLSLVRDGGMVVLPIKEEYMKNLFALPFHHRDPFDRLLVAAAKTEGMIIVTADADIHKYDVPCLW